MLPIQGPSPPTTPTAVPRRRASLPVRSAAFPLAEPSAQSGETLAASATEPALAAAMLALQEGAGPGGQEAVRDRQARRRGGELLEALSALQSALLGGSADPALLQRLAGLAAEPAEAADPGLQRIVAAIRLRARVELARYATG